MTNQSYNQKKLREAKVGSVVKMDHQNYIVKKFCPPNSKSQVCWGCDIAKIQGNSAGIPNCTFWKSCTGVFREDKESVIYKII